MEELILQEFEKQNSKAGHILMLKNLNFGLLQKLNPKQRDQFEPAVNSLIEKGFITYEDGKNGPECFRLTDLGFGNLYLDSRSTDDIEDLILKKFEEQNSKAGHILMLANLNFGLLQKLNPKEKEKFEEAINSLIEKGFITHEDGKNGPECFRLTDLGYENLY
ncbi:hypothetical protein [Flavobacterium soyae]|uniref:Uncharacterized protein n=1 Tax=Flavobacterium soyae TaxID=2903098 RepID=A0ABZ2U9N5_9FLAO